MKRHGMAMMIFVLAVLWIVSNANASGPYTLVKPGVWQGADGNYYERYVVSVKVRHCSYSRCGGSCGYCYYTYRNEYRWRPYQTEYQKAAAVPYQKGWKERGIEAFEALADLNQYDELIGLLASKVPNRLNTASMNAQAQYNQAYQQQGGQASYFPNAITSQAVYGFPTVQQFAGQYPNINLQNSIDIQAAARLAIAADKTSDNAIQRVLSVMEQGVESQREAVRWLAIQQIANQPESRTNQVTFQQAQPQQSQPPQSHGDASASIQIQSSGLFSGQSAQQTVLAANGILASRCATCHSGGDSPKSLDLRNWSQLPYDVKKTVLTSVKSGKMPLLEDRETPNPLPSAEIRILENALLIEAASALGN